MKINVLGNQAGAGMLSHLTELLNRYGQTAYINSTNYDYFDATIILGLWHARKEAMHHNTVLYGCGTDVWDNPYLDQAVEYLNDADLVLYGHPDMGYKTGVNGIYWQLPVDTTKFFSVNPKPVPERDTLIYCPDVKTYKLEECLNYVNNHPEEKCTILGGAIQNFWLEELPENLLSIRSMPYDDMRLLFYNHKKSVKWVNHKATPLSKMCVEAKLCGCKSFLNDVELTKIPEHMLDFVAIPKLIRMLNDVRN